MTGAVEGPIEDALTESVNSNVSCVSYNRFCLVHVVFMQGTVSNGSEAAVKQLYKISAEPGQSFLSQLSKHKNERMLHSERTAALDVRIVDSSVVR